MKLQQTNRPSGYSGTPLAKKLGIKPGHRIKSVGAPHDYERLVAPLPSGVAISGRFRGDVDIWHVFTKSRATLRRDLERAIEEIRSNGAIWISWPKKASGVPTDLTEDAIRALALPLGLVDVKVCAIDETWSGLKLVIRKSLR
ncbi:MAG TPA: DUF3052 domain-containing protein [Gammaproteobacteria bacterium]|nr:DUF3052 domain-containing protein [Gammaproteobacteria bacterium]